jgi:uncharacterized protein YdeI (BOF family)
MNVVNTTLRSLTLGAALVAMTMPALAQSQKPGTPDPQDRDRQQQSQMQSSETSTEAQTFQGTIVQEQNAYVLKDSTGTSYQLDDQQKAKEFSNQTVKVTGKLDTSSRTIHVSSIAKAS